MSDHIGGAINSLFGTALSRDTEIADRFVDDWISDGREFNVLPEDEGKRFHKVPSGCDRICCIGRRGPRRVAGIRLRSGRIGDHCWGGAIHSSTSDDRVTFYPRGPERSRLGHDSRNQEGGCYYQNATHNAKPGIFAVKVSRPEVERGQPYRDRLEKVTMASADKTAITTAS
jgi:hypothetical protein